MKETERRISCDDRDDDASLLTSFSCLLSFTLFFDCLMKWAKKRDPREVLLELLASSK